MKISDLQKGLEEAKKEYGDLDVKVLDPDAMANDGEIKPVDAFPAYDTDDNGAVTGVILMNWETHDALSGGIND